MDTKDFLNRLAAIARSSSSRAGSGATANGAKEPKPSLLVDIATRPQPAQLFAEIREEFFSYARSSSRADRPRLEQAIERIYAASSAFERPPALVWLSPAQFLIAAFILKQEIVKIDGKAPLSSFVSHNCQPTRHLDKFVNNREMLTGTFFSSAVREALDRTARLNWSGTRTDTLWSTIILELIRNSSLTEDVVKEAFPEAGNSRVWYAIDPNLVESALHEITRVSPDATRARALMQSAAEISNKAPLWIQTSAFLNLSDDEMAGLLRNPIHSPLVDSVELARIAVLRKMGYEAHLDEHYLEAIKAGGWWIPFDEICLLCDNPVELHLDDRGRLHNQRGAALAFEEGHESFFVQGFRVPKSLIDGTIPSHEIDSVTNIELRRLMIETIGLETYVLNSDLEKFHEDECGTLYLKRFNFDEPMVVLKVTNSTKEADGSRREYFLRVPPNMVTARQAVAWTFGLNEKEYSPARET